MWPPVGSGALRSKTPMLSSPRKPPWKTLLPFGVLAVHPPGEVEQQLVEDALEEGAVGHAAALLVDLVNAPGGPGVHRRIDVAERPLVGRQLAVGMHVPFAQQQDELLLGELGIDQRQRHAVEGQVPGGVPGILPLVRHGDDVGVVEVQSSRGCGPCSALGRRRRAAGIAVQPVAHVVMVELLRPEHAGEGLAHARSARRPKDPGGMTVA